MDSNDPSVPVTDDTVVSDTPEVDDVSASSDDSGGQATIPVVVDSPIGEAASTTQPAIESTAQSVLAPVFDPHSADEIGFLRTVLGPLAWASHRARTQAKLDRIMVMAREKGQIDRKDVRNLLNCSKPACTRYLTALVRQGKLTRQKSLDDVVYRIAG